MRAFFWPTNVKPNPGVIARFGRVLHWLATIIAIAVVLAGLWAYFTWEPTPYSQKRPLDVVGGTMLGSMIGYFFGRALRYIFSGE
jgi:hypothetical protein